jgi:hypothetical protein
MFGFFGTFVEMDEKYVMYDTGFQHWITSFTRNGPLTPNFLFQFHKIANSIPYHF